MARTTTSRRITNRDKQVIDLDSLADSSTAGDFAAAGVDLHHRRGQRLTPSRFPRTMAC